MAQQVTKIYELRTIGYDQIVKELKSIEKAFENIKILKQALAKQKMSTDDVIAIKQLNLQLEEQKRKTIELRIERQRLVNEGKALQNQKQAEINQSKAAVSAVNAEIGSYNDLANKLKLLNALRRNLNPTSGSTIQFEGQSLNFQQARARALELSNQIRLLGSDMRGANTIGQQMTDSLARGFQNVKGQLGQLLLTYVGWYAAFKEGAKLIQENVKLSDSFADLQIRIKGSKEDVEKLFESLKKIDTRTSLASLVDIANIVAKKGVPKDEIAALTQEFDKLNVVLGKEIGEPATATASIIKLITIFNDDKQVTAQRVNEIGTSLFKLTTTGVATGEFLVNFAERVGAVRGITGLTLPSILGMGAALQQLGQRTEVAGTAAVQLTTRIFTDVPKFAKAAKLSVEEFRDLLADDPFKALVAVGEGLKGLSDAELASNFEEVVTAFGEVGVVGVRVKAVLGDIATNGKFVQQRMNEAVVSTKDYGKQLEAVELKQNTFAATLEKARKQLELVGTNKSVQIVLASIAGILLFLASNLGIITSLLLTYASVWVIANNAMIAARIATIASNVAFTTQYAILVVTTTFMKAYTAALGLFTGATTAATGATRLLSIALKLLPIGIIISLIALLAAGCRRAASDITGTTEALRKQAERMRINQEITEKANASVADQITKYEELVRVVLNTSVSYDTQRRALDTLIEMNGRFSKSLKDNVIDLEEVKRALKEVREDIILNAKAEASSSLTAEAYKKYLQVVSLRQKIETDVAGTGVFRVRTGDLKGDEKELVKSLKNTYSTTTLALDKVIDVDVKNLDKVIAELKVKEEAALGNYTLYLEASSNLKAEVEEKTKEHTKKAESYKAATLQDNITQAQNSKLTKKELEGLLKDIDTELDTIKEGDPKLNKLQSQREIFQKRLDALNNKKSTTKAYRGARLSGLEKDDFSLIDAQLAREIAAEEKRFAELQIVTENGIKTIKQVSFDEEESFVTKIKDINLKYLDQKIKRLESEKTLNAKELQTLENLKKDKVDLELKYIKDVQSINDKEFQDRRNNLKLILEQEIADIKLKQKAVNDNPQSNATDRAQAKLDSDKQILSLQVKFNKDIDLLEKQLNQRSKVNSKEGAKEILKTKEDLLDDERSLELARLVDINDAGSRSVSEINTRYNILRQAILDNDKLTVVQREKALEKLAKLHNFTLISSELATLSIEFKKKEELYRKGLISEKEYLEAKAKLAETAAKQAQAKTDLKTDNLDLPSSQNSQDQLADRLNKLFNFEAGSANAKLLGQVIADSFSLATEAMNNYFDAQEERIKNELSVSLQRLDREKEQVKARAQSQAELESIDKQYAAKKLKAEKEAGEKLKKIKRAEAKIALATELANIAVSAAANPANGVTFGLAGIIMYALLSGLALARYAMNVSTINREQFAFGGNPDMTTTRGGKVSGRSHGQGGNPFLFKGRIFEDEVDELNIIRTKNVNPNLKHVISGTHTQIASSLNRLGGGIDFHPGGRVKTFAYGGTLGMEYKAPQFRSSNTNSSADLEILLSEIKNLANEQSKRIDRIEVFQTTSSVTDAQRKQVKQSKIGSL